MCWQHENISCFKQLLTSQTLLTTFSLTSQVLSLHTRVILILIACRCKVDDLFIFQSGQLHLLLLTPCYFYSSESLPSHVVNSSQAPL